MSDDKPLNVNDPDYDDPIIAEVRRIRAEMEAEWNHDLSQAVRYFQELRRLHPVEGLIDHLPRAAKRA